MGVGNLAKGGDYIELIGGWASASSYTLYFPFRRKGLIMKEAVETFSLESFSLMVPGPLCPLLPPLATSSWPPPPTCSATLTACLILPLCLALPVCLCVTFSHHIPNPRALEFCPLCAHLPQPCPLCISSCGHLVALLSNM